MNNAVATNLVMLSILGFGLLSFQETRIEAFPKIPANTISISTLYAGASAKQIERLVTQKIERQLEGIEGVKKVYAFSEAGISTITVEKNFSTDILILKEKIKTKLDEVYDFPMKMERPILSVDDFSMTAMYITLSGGQDIERLEYFGEQVRQSLLKLPQISKIETWGNSPFLFTIAFDARSLEQYNIGLDEVIAKLEAYLSQKIDGTIAKDGQLVLLEVNRAIKSIKALEGLPILVLPSKRTIDLKALAKVSYALKHGDTVPQFDHENAYGMEVKIRGNESVLEIAKVLKEHIEIINKTLPPSLSLTYWGDSSAYIGNRLALLNSNAIMGIIIVFVLLALFLNIKLAFWVAMGVPLSLAGTMAILGTPWFDYSINDITTLGIILSLGLLVDDAIVIGESVFSKQKKIKNVHQATSKGVNAVATATIFGALTSVAAFIPMFLIQDELIKILTSFSMVIIITLFVSLFESKILLPAHLAHSAKAGQHGAYKNRAYKVTKLWTLFQTYAQNFLRYLNYKVYAPLLKKALNHRYSVLLVMISTAIIGLGLMLNGTVKTLFYPEVPQQYVQIQLDMDSQSNSTLTKKHLGHIDEVVQKLNGKWKDSHALSKKPIVHQFMQVEAKAIEIYLELSSSANRASLDSLMILKGLKEAIGELEGCRTIEYSATESFAGKFEINLYAQNEKLLKALSQELKNSMKNIEGVTQVFNSLEQLLPTVQIELKPIAYSLGFTDDYFSQQISYYFSDTQVGKIMGKNRESKVIVKQFDTNKESLFDVENIKIKNSEGQWFKLSAIATLKKGRAIRNIAKVNAKRVATLSAVLDKSMLSSTELQEQLWQGTIKEIKERYAGVSFDEAGELEAIGVAKKSLTKTLIITMVLIYLLLAIPLKSYFQPLIIMSVIPFGFIGSMLGHLLEGFTFSIFSFLGILALTGIVVNDSLVMMTQYNQKRAKNISVKIALKTASIGRFRAIFLTTVSTVLGLMPLINETSENAQYLIPSAISIAYGEIFATILTLILIPVLIAIKEDIKMIFKTKK